MKRFIFPVIVTLFLIFGCVRCFNPVPLEDDATPYIVNVTFLKPTAATGTKNHALPIEIRFDRNPSGYIHNVKVEILNEKGTLVQKLFESTVTTFKSYTYSDTTIFKPLNAGVYKIRASTTAETKNQENSKEFIVTIQ